MFIKKNLNFKTKSGKVVSVVQPSMKYLDALIVFVNRLVEEDTFLNLTGRPKTLTEEKQWLENTLIEIKNGKANVYWALFEGKIIASVDVRHGGTRDSHVGKIGLMVDRDFRSEGIGKFLLNHILEKAKKVGLRIVTLNIFDDNKIAKNLYLQLGFKEYGRLPRGLYRKGKYSDHVKMYKNI